MPGDLRTWTNTPRRLGRLSGRLRKGVFHPSLATCHTKKPNPYRPTNPSGKGLRWKLSLDQDPSTPTAQVGPGWGTQMHAMRPLLRTKEIFNSPPEGQGRYPKPEEAGKGGSGAAHGGPN